MSSTRARPNIIQLALPEQGRSQSDRLPTPLQQDYVAINEHTQEDLFAMLKGLSEQLKFYTHSHNSADNNWAAFFPYPSQQAEIFIEQNKGQVEPHLALIKVFLDRLSDGPLMQLNALKQAYIDFYYQSHLRFNKRPAQSEFAHVICELKKSVSAQLIATDDHFVAGTREDGSTIYVAPTVASVINHGLVTDKRSLFLPANNPGSFKVATVADSSDGLGEPFDDGQIKWSAFGHEGLPTTQIGFAISSGLLRMAEGIRSIRLSITLSESLGVSTASFNDVFQVLLSHEKGWTDSQFANAELSANTLDLSIELDEQVPPITAYQADIHGYALDADAPVLQCLLNNESSNDSLKALLFAHISSIQLHVEVNGLTTLDIRSDIGPVSADNPFYPFGPAPRVGSCFRVNSPEAFTKRLEWVSLDLEWKNASRDLSSVYQHYGLYANVPTDLSNAYFVAKATVIDGEKRESVASNVNLFNSSDARLPNTVTVNEDSRSSKSIPGTSNFAATLGGFNSVWAQKQFTVLGMVKPQYQLSSGKISVLQSSQRSSKNQGLDIKLSRHFFHDTYRNAYLKNVLAVQNDAELELISEPYTPELSSVSLSYAAYTKSYALSTNSAQSFANDELRFFHLDCFGQRREHSYQRHQLDYVIDKRVSLFPIHNDEGYLFIGLTGVQAGDSCQLLVQTLEGSADPSLSPATLQWSVLCDNYFKNLDEKSLVFDRTGGFQSSGMVRIMLPKETTTQHSLMPSGKVWLKVTLVGQIDSVCQVQDILCNAIEVSVVAQNEGIQSNQFDTLAKGSISKFKRSKPSVKKVYQPFDGYGGRAQESDQDFSARVSARLRHRDRAVSSWDYETLALSEFPTIHKVKALPHAQPGQWESPGHLTLVVVPHVNLNSSTDIYAPKVSTQVLQSIGAYLNQRCAMQVNPFVVNPVYLRVRLQFQVQFVSGMDFNFYRDRLNTDLHAFLAPWTNSSTASENASKSPNFGGKVYKSVVMNFIEELPYVDFITHVLMQTSTNDARYSNDSNIVKPDSPDQILSSAANHVITEFVNE